MNYYNEFDPKAAAWIRELIAAALIPKGEVDERSITDVRGSDLRGFIQCHFFAGIAGWPYALQLAGWPEDRPVWTGSCPCQPFSQAGKGKGESDRRHLWPDFRRLIKECNPSAVFGEQVASKAGRGWLNGVRVDLEELAYEVGSADLCAAGCGAPHIRQRLYWMADSGRQRNERRGVTGILAGARQQPERENMDEAGREHQIRERQWSGDAVIDRGSACGMAQPEHTIGRPEHTEYSQAYGRHGSGGSGQLMRMGDSDNSGPQGRWEHSGEYAGQLPSRPTGASGGMGHSQSNDERREREPGPSIGWDGETGRPGSWSDFYVVHCENDKSRRIEPGTFPLVAGISKGMVRSGDKSAPINPQASPEARITRLRGYGNAIVPELAAEFIRACMDVTDMPGKPEVQLADNEAAQEIARSMVGLNLTPGDPQSWVAAVRHARAEYPSQATIEAAVVELKRLTRPAIHLVTRRGSHQLRRRVK